MSGGLSREALAWLAAQGPGTLVAVAELEDRGVLRFGELEELVARGTLSVTRSERRRLYLRLGDLFRSALLEVVVQSAVAQAGAAEAEVRRRLEACSPDQLEELLARIVRELFAAPGPDDPVH